MKREEDIKKDIVAANLRWEQRWTSREKESTAAHDALVKAIQQQRDRLSSGKLIHILQNRCSFIY